jgi:hypothetical protein
VEDWLIGGRTRSFEGMPSMIEVVLAALESDPSLRRDGWIDQLESIPSDEVDAVLNRLPEEGPSGVILSDTSRTLCSEILRINRMRLLDAVVTHCSEDGRYRRGCPDTSFGSRVAGSCHARISQGWLSRRVRWSTFQVSL